MNLSPPSSSPPSITNDAAFAFRVNATSTTTTPAAATSTTGEEGKDEENSVASSARALLSLARSSSDDSESNVTPPIGTARHISPEYHGNLPNSELIMKSTALLQQASFDSSTLATATPLVDSTGPNKIPTTNSSTVIFSQTSIPQEGTTMNLDQLIVTPAPSSLPEQPRSIYPSHQKQEAAQESNAVATTTATTNAAAAATTTSTTTSIYSNDNQDLVRLGILYIDGGQNGQQRRLRIVTSDTTKTGNAVYKRIPFPNVLYDMLVEQSVSNPSVMRWMQDGTAFIIDPNHPTLAKLLPNYFRHSKFSSLLKQLNTYGWRAIKEGRYNGTFCHPFFRRDRPQDLERIKRNPESKMSKFLKQPKAATRRGRPPKAKIGPKTSSSAGSVRIKHTSKVLGVMNTASPGCGDNWGKKQALLKKKPSKRLTRSKATSVKTSFPSEMNNVPKNSSLNNSTEPNMGRLAPCVASGNGGRGYMESLTTVSTPSFKTTAASHNRFQNDVQTTPSYLETGIEGAQYLLGMKRHPMPFSYFNEESPLTRLVREPLLQYSPAMVGHNNNNVFTSLESKKESGSGFNFSRPSCLPTDGALFASRARLGEAHAPRREEGGNFAPTISTPGSLAELALTNHETTYAASIPFKPVNVSIVNGSSIAISPMESVLHRPRSSRPPAAGIQQVSATSVLPISSPGGSFTNVGINQAYQVGSSISNGAENFLYSLNPLDFNGCTEDNGTK